MVSIKLSISYICYFISKAKLGGISIHLKLNVAVNTTSCAVNKRKQFRGQMMRSFFRSNKCTHLKCDWPAICDLTKTFRISNFKKENAVISSSNEESFARFSTSNIDVMLSDFPRNI